MSLADHFPKMESQYQSCTSKYLTHMYSSLHNFVKTEISFFSLNLAVVVCQVTITPIILNSTFPQLCFPRPPPASTTFIFHQQNKCVSKCILITFYSFLQL